MGVEGLLFGTLTTPWPSCKNRANGRGAIIARMVGVAYVLRCLGLGVAYVLGVGVNVNYSFLRTYECDARNLHSPMYGRCRDRWRCMCIHATCVLCEM